jgi:multisubunit Na+/H+ antiporter MnhB subunit
MFRIELCTITLVNLKTKIMIRQKWNIALLILIVLLLAGCSFIGGVFKTGLGLGALVVIALVILILFISRSGKKNEG